MATQNRYVALLRGINIGKHKKIKMADLRELLGSLGLNNVKTLLASGNVVFESPEVDPVALAAMIQAGIQDRFGFDVPVLLRRFEDVTALVEADPFAGIPVTPETRLYVTFLDAPPTEVPPLPYVAPDNDFTIIRVTESEVCSVLNLSKRGGTVESMAVLEQFFGKSITTRNWNTVNKIAAL